MQIDPCYRDSKCCIDIMDCQAKHKRSYDLAFNTSFICSLKKDEEVRRCTIK